VTEASPSVVVRHRLRWWLTLLVVLVLYGAVRLGSLLLGAVPEVHGAAFLVFEGVCTVALLALVAWKLWRCPWRLEMGPERVRVQRLFGLLAGEYPREGLEVDRRPATRQSVAARIRLSIPAGPVLVVTENEHEGFEVLWSALGGGAESLRVPLGRLRRILEPILALIVVLLCLVVLTALPFLLGWR